MKKRIFWEKIFPTPNQKQENNDQSMKMCGSTTTGGIIEWEKRR